MKAKVLNFVRGLRNGTPPRFQSYLKSLTLLLTMLLSVNVWGEIISFTNKDWAPWTNITSGSSFESSGSARGVANNNVNGSCESPSSFSNITKIEVVASSNATGGKVTIYIGSTKIGEQSIANSNNATYTYSPSSSMSGKVKIQVTKNSKTVYVKSITITAAAADPVETLYLWEAGVRSSNLKGDYKVGAKYTLPSTCSQTCGTKTFVGWSTVEIQTPGAKPTSNYYEPGDEVTLAATNTFYAVYADAAGGADPVAYTAGDEGSFVLAALNDGKWYALPTNPTVDGGKIAGVEISVSQTTGSVNYVTTENAAGYTWTIANATNGQTISDGTTYIYHSNGGSSGTDLAYGNSTTLTWSIESEENGLTFKGMNNGDVKDRGMLVSGTTFGGYSLSNEDKSGYYRISVLPISGATYSNYTTCGSKYSVTFKNQESVISTTEYTAGTVIHAPATAENTCGDGFFFVGWLAQPLYVGATPNPKPAGLIQPNGEITVPAEDVVYYAVFAQKRIN